MAQPAPQMASAVTLVAAGLGVSVVPKAITQVQVAGVVYRPLAGMRCGRGSPLRHDAMNRRRWSGIF